MEGTTQLYVYNKIIQTGAAYHDLLNTERNIMEKRTNRKVIVLTFDLGEICNDVLAKCNLIGQGLKDDTLADTRANIMEPDAPETRSIISRAITEAFGKVKIACSRWLATGRTIDDNRLERIIAGDTEDTEKQTAEGDETETEESAEEDSMKYEKITLTLLIPNFNVAATDHLKSSIHKYAVDYIMSRFLQDQLPDKAAEYKQICDGEDYNNIVKDLNMRENFNFRTPSWV